MGTMNTQRILLRTMIQLGLGYIAVISCVSDFTDQSSTLYMRNSRTEMIDRHTDRQTQRPSTVTLATHAHRGLITL